MLVLSRKAQESIIIAGAIRVVVAEIGRGCVRLAVQAPRDVAVDREEIYLNKILSRAPPEVFTQQEYDVLSDHQKLRPVAVSRTKDVRAERPGTAPRLIGAARLAMSVRINPAHIRSRTGWK